MAHAADQFPHLMSYIQERNALNTTKKWCDQLNEDKAKAAAGDFGEVVADLVEAEAQYAVQQKALGRDPYPYNAGMGQFLGLPINPSSHEPEHGYYMAQSIKSHYRFGVALRVVREMIEAGKPLLIVAARSKLARQPVRFYTFKGPEQIKIEGNTVAVSNGKKSLRLSGNWSHETCMEAVRAAMESGRAFGEKG